MRMGMELLSLLASLLKYHEKRVFNNQTKHHFTKLEYPAAVNLFFLLKLRKAVKIHKILGSNNR